MAKKIFIPVEVSARHIHLSQKDLNALFGIGHKLTKIKQLTQPSDFAAEETVKIWIGGGEERQLILRVVGPIRKETQVELSVTDALRLGVRPVLRDSGNLKNTPGAVLKAVKELKIDKGVIVAARHIHCASGEAKKLGWRNGQFVSIKINGKRGAVFNNVKIRIDKKYKLCFHLDTDEGNAAGINKKTIGYLI